jgi:transposase
MAKALSMDLRERIMAACDAGETHVAVARRFAVSESFIEKLKRRRRETGSLAPKPHAGGHAPLLAAEEERLRAAWQEKPDQTLAELHNRLGLSVHLSTLWHQLQRLGLTFKKNAHRSGTRPRGRTRPTRGLVEGTGDLGPGPSGVPR